MLTYYCPLCWEEIDAESRFCNDCGFNMEEFDQWSYEEKLIAALSHPIPERRMIAAEMLGLLKSERAIPAFAHIIENNETDYYFVRNVLISVAAINHTDSKHIIERACHNPSKLIEEFAADILKTID